MSETDSALREKIAERIWQAEYRRATGKERSIEWAEVNDNDVIKYLYVADAILQIESLRRPTPSASAGAQELRSMADLVPIPQEEASALAGHLKGFASAGAVSELADKVDEIALSHPGLPLGSTHYLQKAAAELRRLASGMPSRESADGND